jgi:hypothetical protein
MEAPIVSGVTDIEQESLHNPSMLPGLNNTSGEFSPKSLCSKSPGKWGAEDAPEESLMTWGIETYYMKSSARKYTLPSNPSSPAFSSPAKSVGSPWKPISSPSNIILSQPLPFIQGSDECDEDDDDAPEVIRA